MVTNICGWHIYQDTSAPITGRWKAIRYGVRMSANTYEMLVRMIRQREEDDRLRQKA